MAIRVPTYERKVRAQPLDMPQARAPGPSGLGEIAKGLGAVGDAVGDIGNDLAKKQAAETARVTKIASAGKEADYQSAIVDLFYDDENGAFNAEGLEGVARTEKAYEALAKRRKEILGSITDPPARDAADVRFKAIDNELREKGEKFQYHQFKEAEKANVEANTNASLRLIAAQPEDDATFQFEIGRLAESYDAYDSDTDGEVNAAASERLNAVRAQGTKLRLDALLQRGNFAKAREILEAEAVTLGGEATAYHTKVDALDRAAQAGGLTGQYVDFATDPETGFVDEEQANALLEKIEDPAVKEEARKLLPSRLNQAEAAQKGTTHRIFNGLFSAYLERDNPADMNAADKEILRKRDPGLYADLERKIAADAKARSGGGRKAGTSPDQAQAMIDLRRDIFKNPQKYEEMDGAGFAAAWGTKLSRADFDEGGRLAAATAKMKPEDKFTISRLNMAVKGAAEEADLDKKGTDDLEGKVALGLQTWRDANPGKQPKPEDGEAIIDRALLSKGKNDLAKKRADRRLESSVAARQKVVAGRQAREAPTEEPLKIGGGKPEKKIAKWQRSADGKSRRPVYDDGTRGEPEAVR